jgi:hypothetical protein
MNIRKWLPHVATLALAALLVITQHVWADSIAERLTSTATGSSKTTINYQGYLTDSSGNPVSDPLDMVFRLYNVESGGDALWTETQSAVAVSDGLFSVLLGSATPISTETIANNNDLWLGIAVGGDEEMSPREKIASAPYAMSANVSAPFVTRSVNLCFTPYFVCDGVVSDFNRITLGSNQIWSGSFSFTPFDRGLVSGIGRIDLADDTTTFGAVPVAVWLESNDTARFSAIVPDRYFNTVNSRLIVALVGR